MTGWHRNSRISDEAGFALMETLISAVVLIVIAVATRAAVDRAQSTSAIGKGRSVAASLAEQDQERLRSLPAVSLSTYRVNHSASRLVTVGGLNYTVASTVDWVRDADGATPSCSTDDNQANYLKITSTVTGTAVRPVTISSLVSPPLAFSNNRATFAVKVLDGGDQPVVGLPVNINGPASMSDTTNAAGCAVFAFIPAGDYHVQFSRAGWVDPTGDNTVDVTPTINPGKLNQLSLKYDMAGALTMRFDTTDTSGAVISSLGWTGSAMHTGVTGTGIRYYWLLPAPRPAPQATISLTDLFPFRTGYQTFAGECPGSNPDTSQNTTNWFTTGGGVGDSIVIPPGDSSKSVTVRQPKLSLKVKDGSTAVQNATVVLTVNDSTCISTTAHPTPVQLTGLKTNSAGLMTKSAAAGYDAGVPFGKYNVCVTAANVGSPATTRRYTSSTPINVNDPNGVTVADINIGAAPANSTPC